ncbi:MAG: TonB-dependent receptor [Bacteroidota bacterium]
MRSKTITRLILLAIFCGNTCISLQAQADSLKLRLDQLGWQDLIFKEKDIGKQQVVSASRTLQNLEDLPFTIYVISKEEIFKNGYTTLVDVLRSVPGIRVSQPGSALDGETFVMRGLYGNSYAKILVNDQPVKPLTANGMPLGAQLPIRQAERIEIIFGPAAAVYGADASAGVINIVLQDTEKPIFTRADLSLGEFGYTDLNVTFGGKIGRDRNVIRFSFYGSNTQYDDRNTIYDLGSIYLPNLYEFGDTSYRSNPNYSTISSVQDALLPHLSQMIGLSLRYRGLSFSFDRMYRREYSAIGLNPVSVSYANPLNTVGETISRYQFGIQKQKEKWGFNTRLMVLNYALDPASSYTYVNNTMWRFLGQTVLRPQTDPNIRRAIRQEMTDSIFSGSRFSDATSFDTYIEGVFNFRPFPYLEITAGANISGYVGKPLNNYIKRQTFDGREANDPFPSVEESDGNIGSFLQLYLNLKKLNVIAGIRYDLFELTSTHLSPRVGMLYKLSPNLSLRGTFATAFRTPNPFFRYNSYLVQEGDLSTLQTSSEFLVLDDESTFNYEFGLRYNWRKQIYADVAFYLTETTNFISYNFGFSETQRFNNQDWFYLGYLNDENSISRSFGIQGRINLQDDSWTYKPRLVLSFNMADGKEVLPFTGNTIDKVRMQPAFLGQADLSFRLYRKLFVHFNNVFATKWVRRFVGPNGETSTNKGYYTFDLLTRIALTSNFQMYLKVNNFFNSTYGGIGATGYLDDLILNPQPLRTARIGLSYSMN